MAVDQAATGPAASSNAEMLMAERQIFWARFCRFVIAGVIAVATILVLLDWTLV